MNYDRKNRKGNFGGSGRKFSSGNRGFGDRDDSRPSLHKAICSECKAECQVPFKPSSGKPVFCRDCFKSKGDTGPKRFGDNKRSFGSERSFGERNSSISNEQFKILNSKLDQILEALDS